MDTLTHAISGAVVGAVVGAAAGGQEDGQHERKQSLQRRMLWGALFAVFPDSDFILAFFVDTLTYLNEHRGLTHSILLLPVWAALLGALGARFSKDSWRDMSLLAGAALAAHILGDLITSYGTKLLMPLVDTPFAFPITFIIDPVFTGILLIGVVVTLWRVQRWPAMAAGVALLCYLGVQTWAHDEAEDFGRQVAMNRKIESPIVTAFPQPLSPMHWMVIIAHGNGYERAYIDLLETAARPEPAEDAGFFTELQSAYRPREDAFWFHYPRWPESFLIRQKAEQAWQQPAFEGFREFALLPYVAEIRTQDNALCVWSTDLRFNMPARENPFRFAMCETLDGSWELRESRLNGERLE